MTIEIILLALASTIRPTSLAAVYAVLSTGAPRRLMIVYIAAGLAFTVAFGLLVVLAFHGINVSSGSSRARGIAEIVGGGAMLAFAAGVLTGRVGGRHPDDAPGPSARLGRLLEHRLTPRTAAIAGPATHIPGLFYLVALNVIVAHDPSPARGALEVLLYNAIWFAVPLCALVVCIVEPAAARTIVGAIQDWTKEHARTILVVAAAGAGAALIVHGLLTL